MWRGTRVSDSIERSHAPVTSGAAGLASLQTESRLGTSRDQTKSRRYLGVTINHRFADSPGTSSVKD